MDATTIIMDRLDAYMMRVAEVMDDIGEEELMRQPGDQDNPIGWLMWHMTRFEDRTFAHITGEEQAWTKGNWFEKFGVPENPEETGVGQTSGSQNHVQHYQDHPRHAQSWGSHHGKIDRLLRF